MTSSFNKKKSEEVSIASEVYSSLNETFKINIEDDEENTRFILAIAPTDTKRLRIDVNKQVIDGDTVKETKESSNVAEQGKTAQEQLQAKTKEVENTPEIKKLRTEEKSDVAKKEMKASEETTKSEEP